MLNKKFFFIVIMAQFLLGCAQDSTSVSMQKQHFICKSLIEGFLKINQLGNYVLYTIEPRLLEDSTDRLYRYRVQGDQNIRLNMPSQRDLKFQCLETNHQTYQVKLLDQRNREIQDLLSLQVPPQQVIKKLTAYQLAPKD